MATANALPSPEGGETGVTAPVADSEHVSPAESAPASEPVSGEESASNQALVAVPPEPAGEDFFPPNSAVPRLPVEVDVAVPVREFRVRTLLALAPGQLIETTWAHSEDLPLCAGEVQLAWSEFEVVDTELAVRITRLV